MKDATEPRLGDVSAVSVVIDRDGKPAACTEAYARMFGRMSDLHGWDAAGHEVHGLRRVLGDHLRAGEPFRQSLELDSIAGGRHAVQVSGQPMYDDGEHVSGMLLLFDPPSVADKATEIAALLSHEIRTPLTVLHAALQLLARVLPDEPNDAARRYLTEAMAEARQLNVLTAQLHDASRLQAGELRLRSQPLSLSALVCEVALKARAMSPGQLVQADTPARDVWIEGDRGRLEQMLMSLLTNAFMYAPTAQRVDMRLRRDGDDAVVEVRDYGAGIDPGRLAHVAEPFYQLPRLDRPSRGGLGLSLYLCRELAELHGGGLDIRSDTGEGSTFALRLPLAAQPAERVREDVRPARKTARRR